MRMQPRKTHRVAMHGEIYPMRISSRMPLDRPPTNDWLWARFTSGWSRMCHTSRTRAIRI